MQQGNGEPSLVGLFVVQVHGS